MFKAIANWFKGLFGKAEQQVAKEKQIVDSFEQWKSIVEMPVAKEEVKASFPEVAKETVAPAEKKAPKKASTKPASKTSKTSTKTTKTSAKPAQKAAPKSKTTKTTK